MSENAGQAEKRQMRIWWLAVGLFLFGVAVVIFVFAPDIPVKRSRADRMRCGSNLASIGKAMLIYAEENNGFLPDANNWCDLLIMYVDLTPEQFVCHYSGAKIGESSYALNSNVAGKKFDDLDPGVVLVFETNLGVETGKRTELVKNRRWFGNNVLTKKYKGSKKVYKYRWNQAGTAEIITRDHHKGEGCYIAYADTHVSFEKHFDNLNWGDPNLPKGNK